MKKKTNILAVTAFILVLVMTVCTTGCGSKAPSGSASVEAETKKTEAAVKKTEAKKAVQKTDKETETKSTDKTKEATTEKTVTAAADSSTSSSSSGYSQEQYSSYSGGGQSQYIPAQPAPQPEPETETGPECGTPEYCAIHGHKEELYWVNGGYYKDIPNYEYHTVCFKCGTILEDMDSYERGNHINACGSGYGGRFIEMGTKPCFFPQEIEHSRCSVCGEEFGPTGNVNNI